MSSAGETADINVMVDPEEGTEGIYKVKVSASIEKDDKIIPSRIGKRVSELYIDPLTAHHFIECFNRAMKTNLQPFSYLHMIADTIEMKPFLSVRSKEYEMLTDKMSLTKFLVDVPTEWDLEFDEFIKSVKTALMLDSWMNEFSEDMILSKFSVTPGELRTRLRNADWLLYSAQELALLLGMKSLLKGLRKVRVRMKYGVKEELFLSFLISLVG